ncbi:GNAT family N-acetyltransferase [Thalassotalea piscium]|uniref:Ribosomal protein S18 acetylase RimI-like enzyme n=1 Tax=Thalassotalea piscium TaxID=1230533 RepID=A0A7X0TTU9_9GAMM|nr:GNAT family N-acetyltransferase [Thalassotalea piscium]MBB6543647.1 ribosomal protein S18 acetylase RimI-like enzyme [Thalassotalea piscium]
MKAEISFKRATTEDKGFLLELRKLSMGQHLAAAGINLSDDEHLQRINEFFQESFVIQYNGKSIGVVKLGLLPDRLHIRQLQILPEFHNGGIGSKVVTLVKQKASERLLPVTLNVLLKNPAKRLYDREGFIVEGQSDLEYKMRWQPS